MPGLGDPWRLRPPSNEGGLRRLGEADDVVRLARAVARGELDPSVDQELLIDMLIGPLWTRLLITRDPVTREYVDANVQAVLTAFHVHAPRN